MAKSAAISHTDEYLFSVAGSRYLALPSRVVSTPLIPTCPATPPLTVLKHLILPDDPDFALVTVISLPQEQTKFEITGQWGKERVQKCNSDDVFHGGFFSNIVFHGAEEDNIAITAEAAEYLAEIGNKQTVFSSLPRLLPGPYACVNQELREVWKLVDDSNGTCMITLKPSSRRERNPL